MASLPKLARRTLETESPVMVQIQELVRGVKDAISLAQGVVYWQPPNKALGRVKDLVWDPEVSRYGADVGIPELREALIKKAFTNIVLALFDPGDSVVMFAPYYFNAYMTFQMTGVTKILVGPGSQTTLYLDEDWLEKTLKETKPVPKVVTVVNPGNPSGKYIPEPLLKRIAEVCREAGAWFIVDNTYEYFMYDGLKHSCIEGDHIVNIFSFSKAYGMMGWRVGYWSWHVVHYIAYPDDVEGLSTSLLKVQDNIPICASIISQRLALYCLEVGREWVTERVKGLVRNRDILAEALFPLEKGAVKGGQGAIYLWAKLPDDNQDDFQQGVYWLAHTHRVVVIPGSACGCPDHLRISFAGMTEAHTLLAAQRLNAALHQLLIDGFVPTTSNS